MPIFLNAFGLSLCTLSLFDDNWLASALNGRNPNRSVTLLECVTTRRGFALSYTGAGFVCCGLCLTLLYAIRCARGCHHYYGCVKYQGKRPILRVLLTIGLSFLFLCPQLDGLSLALVVSRPTLWSVWGRLSRHSEWAPCEVFEVESERLNCYYWHCLFHSINPGLCRHCLGFHTRVYLI